MAKIIKTIEFDSINMYLQRKTGRVWGEDHENAWIEDGTYPNFKIEIIDPEIRRGKYENFIIRLKMNQNGGYISSTSGEIDENGYDYIFGFNTEAYLSNMPLGFRQGWLVNSNILPSTDNETNYYNYSYVGGVTVEENFQYYLNLGLKSVSIPYGSTGTEVQIPFLTSLDRNLNFNTPINFKTVYLEKDGSFKAGIDKKPTGSPKAVYQSDTSILPIGFKDNKNEIDNFNDLNLYFTNKGGTTVFMQDSWRIAMPFIMRYQDSIPLVGHITAQKSNISTALEQNIYGFLPNIYDPINVFPNSSNTIDVTKTLNGKFTFQGSKASKYVIQIYSEDDDYTMPEVNPLIEKEYTQTIYNGESVEYSILASDLQQELVNGQNYKYRILFRDEGAEYSSPFYPLYTASSPEVEININGQDYSSGIEQLDTNILTVSGSYSQEQEVGIKYYNFTLKDENQNIIDHTDNIYSQNIQYTYSGLLENKTYYLSYNVVAQNNMEVTDSIELKTIYSSYSPESSLNITLENNNKNNSIIIKWDSAVIRVKQVGGQLTKIITGYNIGRRAPNETVDTIIAHYELSDLQSYIDDSDYYFISDYSCENNKQYVYSVYCLFDGGITSPESASIITDWEGWVIYPLIQIDDKHFEFELDTAPEYWKFLLNIEEDSLTLNQDKTVFTTFASMPKISIGKLNYFTGSLNCLLGAVEHNYQYYEPTRLKDDWVNFLKENSVCLYKNYKGDSFVVMIDDQSSLTYMNEVGNRYENGLGEETSITTIPTTIGFQFTQIADTKDLNLVLRGE